MSQVIRQSINLGIPPQIYGAREKATTTGDERKAEVQERRVENRQRGRERMR